MFISTEKNARETGWGKIRISLIYINREDYKRDRMGQDEGQSHLYQQRRQEKIGWDKIRIRLIYINKDYKKDRME